MNYIFEWDENKDKRNIKKHGIHFEDVISIFADPNALTRFNRIEKGEQRWETIGLTENHVLLIVIHTILDNINNIEIIRIISARKAKTKERKIYEQNYPKNI